MRRKKEEAAAPAPTQVSAEAAGTPMTPLTPRDIQEKVFKTQAGLRGYNEREVDEFLDRITEDFARLHAENQRLRAALAAGPAAVPTPAAGAPVAPDGTGEITSEFVAREREFLKNLAMLIQSHAEAVKQDIGKARGASVPTVAPEPAAQAPAPPPPPPSPAPIPEPAAVAVGAEGAALTVPGVAQELPMPMPGGAPEPAMAHAETSSSQEPPDEQTIRELFWGED